MPSGSEPTSPTPSVGAVKKESNGHDVSFTRSSSYDPTPYVQRARVTRTAPPKPASNPLQFVQIKPCNLYQSAQEQLKRAEEVKKVKEIKKEEPEDWQSNLDNWKSCRRKRVEHIIDRVVEAKKLEMEEHDRNRKKSKTFSEMLEERGTKGRKCSLQVYTEEDGIDFSDLGIGTSSTSGKSSLSEDFDNHSVISDNPEIEKAHSDVDINSNHGENGTRDYISSPGYDTSSSTAPASSPDPSEYSAYESRLTRIQNNITTSTTVTTTFNGIFSKDSTPERSNDESLQVPPPRFKPKIRSSTSKIEERLVNYECKVSDSGISSDDRANNNCDVDKKDLPKIDILKRRELFENATQNETSKTIESKTNKIPDELSSSISIKQRLSNLEKRDEQGKEVSNAKMNRISGDFSVRDRLSSIENSNTNAGSEEKVQKIDVPVAPLKDRLQSLQSSVPANDSDDMKVNSKVDKKPEPKPVERSFIKDKISLAVTVNEESLVSMVAVNTVQSATQRPIEIPIEGIRNISVRDEPISPTSNTESLNGEKINTKPLPMKKPEVLPRRQITPDLVKVQPKSEEPTVDSLIDLQTEQIDEDDSVSSNNTISTIIENANFTEDKHLTEPSRLVNKFISDDHCNKPMVMVNEKEEEKEEIKNDRVVGLESNEDQCLNIDKLIVDKKPVTDLKIHLVNNVIESYKPFAVLTPKLTISDNAYVEPPQPKSIHTADVTIVTNENDNVSNSLINNSNQIDINGSAKNIANTNNQSVNNDINLIQSNDKINEVDEIVDKCPVVEESCKKIDVHKLPDPNNVATPFINMPYEKIDEVDNGGEVDNDPKYHQPIKNKSFIFNSVDEFLAKEREVQAMKDKNEHPTCHSADAIDETSSKENEVESMKAKNERLKCQIVGVLEKKRKPEAEIQVKVTEFESAIHDQLPPPTPPPRSPKSPSKTRTIFDYIKKNLLNDPNQTQIQTSPQSEPSVTPPLVTNFSRIDHVDNSKFYIPLTDKDHTNVSQTSDAPHSKTASSNTLSGSNESEINKLLDEELSKLSEDELKH